MIDVSEKTKELENAKENLLIQLKKAQGIIEGIRNDIIFIDGKISMLKEMNDDNV